MDFANDNVLDSWVEGLTNGTGVASYMRGWGVGDYKIVATHLAHALKRERARSSEGLEARVTALEEKSHEPVDVRPQLRAIARDVARQEIAAALDGITEKLRRL